MPPSLFFIYRLDAFIQTAHGLLSFLWAQRGVSYSTSRQTFRAVHCVIRILKRLKPTLFRFGHVRLSEPVTKRASKKNYGLRLLNPGLAGKEKREQRRQHMV